MVLAVEILLGAAILLTVGLLAAGYIEGMAPAPPEGPRFDLPDRPLTASDVSELRFPLALRGYRMSDVDRVLDRLGAQLTATTVPAAPGAAADAATDPDLPVVAPPLRFRAHSPLPAGNLLLGIVMGGGFLVVVLWALAAADRIPTLVAYLASGLYLAALPLVWQVYAGDETRAGDVDD